MQLYIDAYCNKFIISYLLIYIYIYIATQVWNVEVWSGRTHLPWKKLFHLTALLEYIYIYIMIFCLK